MNPALLDPQYSTAAPAPSLPSKDPLLAKLVKQWRVERLGDGDLNAGLNVLATQALTLAALALPATRFRGTGSVHPIGHGWLLSGASTQWLGMDILRPVLALQDTLNARVDDYQHAAANHKPHGQVTTERMRTTALDAVIHNAMGFGDTAELLSPDAPTPEQLCRKSRLVVNSCHSQTIAAAATKAHQNRILVCLPIDDAARASGLATTVHALRHHAGSGVHLDGVEGIVAASMDTRVLAVCLNTPQGRWVENLPWLLDMKGILSCPSPDRGVVALDDVHARFEAAARRVVEGRVLQRPDDLPDFGKPLIAHHREYLTQLAHLEDHCPGVLACWRSLPYSLGYGLIMMLMARPFANGQVLMMEHVFALARHLALRATAARSRLFENGEQARLQALCSKLVKKLAESGPSDIRRLTRKTHKLTAPYCEQALDALLRAGHVTKKDGVWSLVEQSPEPPCIDV